MMILPEFELERPKTLAAALQAASAAKGNFDWLSGGTDLLPNYKCGINTNRKVISLRLFNADGSPSNTGAQNRKIRIGNVRMIFDFTAGITNFGIQTDAPGQARFLPSSAYRIIGPAGERQFTADIYGRDLPIKD